MTTSILLALPLLLISFLLVGCSSKDIKYDKAIKIAKSDFGCEKILWIQDAAIGYAVEAFEDGREVNKIKSHSTYYVVGEKDGEEIYSGALPPRP